MKIKTDFVTNSSSSSFIVIFDKKINKLDDVLHLIPVEKKARQVLKDAVRQKPTKLTNNQKIIDRISTELSHGYIDELKSYSDYQADFCHREGITVQDMYANRAWMQAFYDEYEVIQTRLCKKKAIELVENHSGKYMYLFNYGDEDGEFMSQMEHGGTFRNLPHIKINKH